MILTTKKKIKKRSMENSIRFSQYLRKNYQPHSNGINCWQNVRTGVIKYIFDVYNEFEEEQNNG